MRDIQEILLIYFVCQNLQDYHYCRLSADEADHGLICSFLLLFNRDKITPKAV